MKKECVAMLLAGGQGSRLYALAEIANYRFTAPTEDLEASDTVLPVLGTLQVTELEAE